MDIWGTHLGRAFTLGVKDVQDNVWVSLRVAAQGAFCAEPFFAGQPDLWEETCQTFGIDSARGRRCHGLLAAGRDIRPIEQQLGSTPVQSALSRLAAQVAVSVAVGTDELRWELSLSQKSDRRHGALPRFDEPDLLYPFIAGVVRLAVALEQFGGLAASDVGKAAESR